MWEKTQIWNQAGIRPDMYDAAQAENPSARVWRGSMVPTDRQGHQVCSGRRWVTLIVWPDTSNQLCKSTASSCSGSHAVKDPQSAWLLLLHCASARANYMLRSVDPDRTGEFARAHDEGIWQCAYDILQIEAAQTDTVRSIASLTLVLGGLGLRRSERVRSSAYWASWPIAFRPLTLVTLPCRSSVSWKVIPTRHACGQSKKPQGLWRASWGGAHHHGSLSGRVLHQTLISQRSSSQAANVVGSTRRASRTDDSETRTCLSGLTNSVKRLSGLRAWSWSRLGHLPNLSYHEDRTSALSHCPPSPPQSPSSLVRALLPVWPSTRSSWPPPCSLRKAGILGRRGVPRWRR